MTHINKLQDMILQAKNNKLELNGVLPFDLWYSMHKDNLIVDKQTAKNSYERLLKIANS